MKNITVIATMIILCGATFGQMDLFNSISERVDLQPSYNAGSWVEYKIVDSEGEESIFKFSVLSGGEDDEPFIFEYKTVDDEGVWSIMQFEAPDPMDKNSYSYMIMQRRGDVARKIPAAAALGTETAVSEDEVQEPEVDVTTKKNVKVEVEAGSFETTRIDIHDDDTDVSLWVTDEVPLFGLVKAGNIVKDGNNEKGFVELTGYGLEGAKSEIEGEIQEIDLPNLQKLMRLAAPPQNN